MTRLFKAIILALTATVLFYGVALAAWAYLFPITIVDTSNTTRTYYPVFLGFGGQALIDAGKISANGTDTNMQVSGTNIKYMMATGNVTAVLPSLPSGGIAVADLYTGYSPAQAVFAIVTGDGGYVTVADNASLELGDNFTIQTTWYVNTLQVGNLVNKPDAFVMNVAAANIMEALAYTGTATTTNKTVGGAGDYTNIAGLVGAGTHWQAVSSMDAGASYVATTNNLEVEKDMYAIVNPGIPNGSTISSVTVHIVIASDSAGNVANGKPYLRLGGVEVAGTTHTLSTLAYVDYSDVIARPGGGTWSVSDLASLQIGLGLWINGAGHNATATHVYAIIAYTPIYYAAIAGISPGQMAVTTTMVGGNMTLEARNAAGALLGSNTVVTGAASVYDNVNAWTIGSNTTPYTDNISITINGTQQLYFAPNVMISGTNIPDRSGQSHNGTITWGSNSGITITYGEMTSFASYSATSNVTEFQFSTAAMPSSWFASGGNASALPFYDSFSSVSAQTGQPVQTLYALGIIGLGFGAFLGMVMFTRSALLAYISMTMIFGIGASMTIIPGWIVFVMVIVGAGIMYLYKQVAY